MSKASRAVGIFTGYQRGYYHKFNDNHVEQSTEDSLKPTVWKFGVSPVLSTATFVSDPLWKDKIRKHQNATHAYSLRKYAISGELITDIWEDQKSTTFSGYAYYRACDVGLGPITSIPVDASLDDIALGRLKGRLANLSGNTNLLIPLGELEETRHLLRDVIHSATDVFKSLLKIKESVRRPREQLKRASGAWLNWSFGIAPLISDVNSAANALNSALERTSDREVIVYGRSKKDWLSSYAKTSSASPCTTQIDFRASYKHSLKYQYKAGFLLPIVTSTSYSVDEHFGLVFSGVFPAAWELVPYSWLVDYFTTTGAFLTDFWTSPAGSTVYCSKTVTYSVEEIVTVAPHPTSSVVRSFTFGGGNLRKLHFLLDRSDQGVIPHRALRFKTVDEIGLGSLSKLLNLGSLLTLRK